MVERCREVTFGKMDRSREVQTGEEIYRGTHWFILFYFINTSKLNITTFVSLEHTHWWRDVERYKLVET